MSAAPHLLLVHSASNILACATSDVMRDPLVARATRRHGGILRDGRCPSNPNA